VDEHGNGEFPIGERRDNVRQVGPYCLNILGILVISRTLHSLASFCFCEFCSLPIAGMAKRVTFLRKPLPIESFAGSQPLIL
jgi:hypothetical protein